MDGGDQQRRYTLTLIKVRLKVTVSTKKYVMVTMMMVINDQNQWKWMKVTNIIIFNRFRASLLSLICVSWWRGVRGVEAVCVCSCILQLKLKLLKKLGFKMAARCCNYTPRR